MLMVSDLIEVVQQGLAQEAVVAKSETRFSQDEDKKPVVVWNTCQHCNMTCPHCYAAAVNKPSPTDLNHEEALRLIDDLSEAGIRILIFSGGEPLLRKDLFELMTYAKSKRMIPFLSTNGVLIDDSVARKLKEIGVAYVGISIDGLEEFNDQYRGMAGGYQKAWKALGHCHEHDLRTGVRTTLTKQNVHQLDELITIAKSVGVGRYYVSHLLYSGRGKRMADDDLTPQETRDCLIRLFEMADEFLKIGEPMRIVTGSNDSDGVLLLTWLREKYGHEKTKVIDELLLLRGGNSAGEGIVDIDHMGNVHPDQFWTRQTFGNVKTTKFSEILKHPFRKELRERNHYLKGRCGSCQFKSICRGSHRERALAVYGDVWAEDPACVMTDQEIGVV